MNQLLLTLMLACMLAGSARAASQTMPPAMAERTAACVLCHGKEGRATSAGYLPRIAGKPQSYLYNQLRHFREGRRINPQMNSMLANLSDDYLWHMAGYFAAQHPPYSAPQAVGASAQVLERGRQLALLGDPAGKVPACVTCHGQQLGGTLPAVPGLLGLPRDYLNLQFGAWRTGVRRAGEADCMADVARRLSAGDVAAVAAWLSSQPVPEGYAAAPASAPLPMACGTDAGGRAP